MNKKKSCAMILVGVVRVRVLHVTKGVNSHRTCGGCEQEHLREMEHAAMTEMKFLPRQEYPWLLIFLQVFQAA